MVRRKLMGLLVCSMVLGLASVAWAGVPDTGESYAITDATAQVSVMVCPNGDGFRIDDCQYFGGAAADATIHLYVRDAFGDPVAFYPAADMWLESETKAIVLCPGGSTADADTDINGETEFTNALFAGCCGDGALIIINGQAIAQPALDFKFNSPDISCDGVVNLTDVTLFAVAYYNPYDYCADFYWDGVMNLSDIVLLAQHNGHECP